MANLFAQLSIKNSAKEIEFFIVANRGIPVNQAFANAGFGSTIFIRSYYA
jgi:hypothetical protein